MCHFSGLNWKKPQPQSLVRSYRFVKVVAKRDFNIILLSCVDNSKPAPFLLSTAEHPITDKLALPNTWMDFI